MENSGEIFEHEFFSALPPAFSVRKHRSPGVTTGHKLDLRPFADLSFTEDALKTTLHFSFRSARQMILMDVILLGFAMLKLYQQHFVHFFILLFFLLILFFMDRLKKIQLYHDIVRYLNC